MYARSLQLCPTLWDPMNCSLPGFSPDENTAVGCHALFQGIFPTQGSNLRLFMSGTLAGGFLTTSITWEAKTATFTECY